MAGPHVVVVHGLSTESPREVPQATHAPWLDRFWIQTLKRREAERTLPNSSLVAQFWEEATIYQGMPEHGLVRAGRPWPASSSSRAHKHCDPAR